jgi:5-methylcytosine-specific restriction endonuclease McrA
MKKTFRSFNSTLRRTPFRPKMSTKLVQNRTCPGIKLVSKTQSKINVIWNKTVKICKARCEGVCEVRGPDCLYTYGITPHHIISRARGGSHTPANCILGCQECHNHFKYSGGIPLSVDFALELVKRLNEEHGIV